MKELKGFRSNGLGCGFYTFDDHGNVLRQGSQKDIYADMFQQPWAEHYMQGHLYLCLEIAARGIAEKFKLVFGAVPLGRNEKAAAPGSYADNSGEDGGLSNACRDGKGDLMLMGTGNPAEHSESIISSGITVPSWVWLAQPKCWEKLFRNSFALWSLPSGKAIFEIVGTFAEGEMAMPVPLPVDDNSGRKDSLIERIPEVFEGVGRETTKLGGKGLSQLQLADILSCIRIELDDSGNRITFGEKAVCEGLELMCFFPSPRR